MKYGVLIIKESSNLEMEDTVGHSPFATLKVEKLLVSNITTNQPTRL